MLKNGKAGLKTPAPGALAISGRIPGSINAMNRKPVLLLRFQVRFQGGRVLCMLAAVPFIGTPEQFA